MSTNLNPRNLKFLEREVNFFRDGLRSKFLKLQADGNIVLNIKVHSEAHIEVEKDDDIIDDIASILSKMDEAKKIFFFQTLSDDLKKLYPTTPPP